MNQLILHDYGFKFIPKEAEKEFKELFRYWYEGEAQDKIVPKLRLDSFAVDIWEMFGDITWEISAFNFVKSNLDRSQNYPVPFETLMDLRIDERQDFIDQKVSDERIFLFDMERYMNHYRVFYIEKIMDREYYRNKPITEVW